MYTPGSRPPITYSAAGAPKYIHPPSAINAAGTAASHRGRGAAGPRSKLPNAASASVIETITLLHTSRFSEYAPIAARANAIVIETMTLSITAQNRRSSAGRAARVDRAAIGSRKMIAPGR